MHWSLLVAWQRIAQAEGIGDTRGSGCCFVQADQFAVLDIMTVHTIC